MLREVHPIPGVDQTLAKLSGARVFSKLDANSGYWQIPLAEESHKLTTFVTPHGRFCFNKLPFGISSAPELFQRRINGILDGLDGVICMMDDILVFARDANEHDRKLQQKNVTLNREKCMFRKKSIKFLGHLINADGVRTDPDKTTAIVKMAEPKSVPELRKFLGMVNQMGKFSSLAELTQPLRELLSSKVVWTWGSRQQEAFKNVKEELSRPTVLAKYDPQAPLKVSADSSSFGIGAVLLQRSEETWKPVVYASRALSETERRYAQIEKEALAVTWACEKFLDYILG